MLAIPRQGSVDQPTELRWYRVAGYNVNGKNAIGRGAPRCAKFLPPIKIDGTYSLFFCWKEEPGKSRGSGSNVLSTGTIAVIALPVHRQLTIR